MDGNRPKGFGQFDNLMRKLVKVPQAEMSEGWTCQCGAWNHRRNRCRRCGNAKPEAKRK